MRYSTFRALMIAGGVLCVGAGVAGAAISLGTQPAPAVAAATESAKPTPPPPKEATILRSPTATTSAEVAALRPMDKALLDKLHEPLRADSQKDAFPQQAYRVNVYQEAGHTTPNRLDVDLNRNEKWDERWTVDGAAIKREVAPSDDEHFTKEYVLENGSWVPKN
ncbi:MAG: hypothetical protein U0414_37335 [Polyangiaceae bacterium]